MNTRLHRAQGEKEWFVADWNIFLRNSKKHFEENWFTKKLCCVEINDFDIKQTIGTGSFARVVLARFKKNGRFYAIKILYKTQILKMKQLEHTLNEKRILQSIVCPFLVHMEMFFKDNSNLYFVMPYVAGGDMYTYLRKVGKCSEYASAFYAAQIVLALEYLHHLDVVYRDLKPENILIDQSGYLKITDLGFCKVVKDRTYSLCGTPEYLAPEIILSKGYGLAVDWWALGVLVYEMCAGFPPFYSTEPLKIYEQIVAGKYRVLPTFSEGLRHLLAKLLQTDENQRYGNLKNGVNDLKNHPWFSNTVWLDIVNKQAQAPYTPKVKSYDDTSNFEKYEEEIIQIASCEWYPEEFKDF